MKIDVYAAHTHVSEKDIRDKQSIVIDTLRATSTIITALANGCEQVIPVEEVGQAMELKARMEGETPLLGGERDGLLVPGFDLDNSPRAYTSQAVFGRTIILTTTNGTRALAKAADATHVFVGAMINASAVAQAVCENNEDLVILCAGTHGRFSTDDCLTAGYIIDRIIAFGQDKQPQIDDLGLVCLALYQHNLDDISVPLAPSMHVNTLIGLGFGADVNYCFDKDSVSVVPVFSNSSITLDHQRSPRRSSR